uniref:Uncharacterized protein n=1 Tax=Anguilla anguilla TaxID=7936 RepID=A0A0E9UVU3_ANGAN
MLETRLLVLISVFCQFVQINITAEQMELK